jgi:hypothetical protein
VIEGGTAFAGPRSLDLEPATAGALGLEAQAPLVRAEMRRRLALDPIAPEHEFRGWVRLAWGDEISVTPVPPGERVALLVAHSHRPAGTLDSLLVLELAARPALELRRPRDLERLPHACAALVEAIERLG